MSGPAGVILGEWEAAKLLSAHGVPFAACRRASTPEEAARAAAEVGYPVVLKVDSPDITHKTEVGGVVTSLVDDAAVLAAARRLLDKVHSARPAAAIKGVLVQPQLRGHEVIVGGLRDLQFGPVVMFGFGGIYAEVFQDTAFRLAPLTLDQALDLVAEVRSSRVLEGWRGRPPADIDALGRLIVAVGNVLVEDTQVREIDLNPVFVFARGCGCAAADALVALEPRTGPAMGEASAGRVSGGPDPA